MTRFRLALAVLAIASATILGAWAIEAMGYKPCELCLLGRIPYYVGIAAAAATALVAWRGQARLAGLGFVALGLCFLTGAGIAGYHAGVEYKLWQGPAECTGGLTRDLSPEDFLKALKRVKPVRCDEPALLMLGLSLAGWSVLASLGLAALAGWGLRLRR